jgi:hypothetical protein
MVSNHDRITNHPLLLRFLILFLSFSTFLLAHTITKTENDDVDAVFFATSRIMRETKQPLPFVVVDEPRRRGHPNVTIHHHDDQCDVNNIPRGFPKPAMSTLRYPLQGAIPRYDNHLQQQTPKPVVFEERTGVFDDDDYDDTYHI